VEEEEEDERDSMTCDLEYEFSHLSEDKTTATFHPVDFNINTKHKATISSRLQSAMDRKRIEVPKYTTVVHSDVNDGPIPDLSLDEKTLQISLDWRGMYSIFFGEEQIYHKLLSNWTKQQKQWTIGLQERMGRGELNMDDMLQQVLEGFATANEEARQNARRARIRREYQRFDPERDVMSLWNNEEEKKQMEALKQTRFVLGFPDGEESEEEDDDEEAEKDEEDEWEDEDDSVVDSDADDE